VNLEELERDVLRGARRELAPAAADRERHHAELLARLSAARASEPLALGGRTGPSTGVGVGRGSRVPLGGGRFGALGMGLLIGAIVGALIGGWVGFELGRGGWGGAEPGPSRAGEPVPGVGRAAGGEDGSESGRAGTPVPAVPNAERALPAEGAPLREPALVAEEVQPSSHEDERASHGAAARPRPPRAPVPSAASTESSLAAELAMLQRARRALAAENGGLALGIVEELDERFPRGLLLEERTATRVLSLCKLERVDAARREALRFLERYPASVYAERVRQSCAGPVSE
jgi:hypothetical protein